MASIDLAKFVCAFLIITIHSIPFYSYFPVANFFFIEWIGRLAVLVFFAFSGYLFYGKILIKGYDKQILFKYLGRLIVVYLVWSLIYFPIDVIYRIYESPKDILYISLSYLRNLVLQGSHFYLWFFPSLIFCTLFFYYFTKGLKIEYLLVISVILFIVGLLGDSYYGLIKNTHFEYLFKLYKMVFTSTKNGIFLGQIYFTIGAYLAKRNVQNNPDILFFIIFISLNLVEIHFIKNHHLALDWDMTLFQCPTVYFLLKLILNWKVNINEATSKHLRNLSILMYCAHGIPLWIFRNSISDSIIYFLLVFSIAFLLSELILRSKIKLFKLLY